MTDLRTRLDNPARPTPKPGHVTIAVRDQQGRVVCWVQSLIEDAAL